MRALVEKADILGWNKSYSILAHDKKESSYEGEESSIGDRPIPKNATAEAL